MTHLHTRWLPALMPAPMHALIPALIPALVPALVLSALSALVSPVFGQDRADIDRTRIIGNRELPKVLYIVPWKKPLPGELSGRPSTSVIDEALAPIDRDVFRRQVQYDGQAKPAAAPTQAVAAPSAK